GRRSGAGRTRSESANERLTAGRTRWRRSASPVGASGGPLVEIDGPRPWVRHVLGALESRLELPAEHLLLVPLRLGGVPEARLALGLSALQGLHRLVQAGGGARPRRRGVVGDGLDLGVAAQDRAAGRAGHVERGGALLGHALPPTTRARPGARHAASCQSQHVRPRHASQPSRPIRGAITSPARALGRIPPNGQVLQPAAGARRRGPLRCPRERRHGASLRPPSPARPIWRTGERSVSSWIVVCRIPKRSPSSVWRSPRMWRPSARSSTTTWALIASVPEVSVQTWRSWTARTPWASRIAPSISRRSR